MIYILILLGLGLRLISLNQSFWLDEATSATVAQMSLKELLNVFSLGDFHPPFYYLILHYWGLLFGFTEVGLRMLSVLTGTGTIYVVYLIGRYMIDKKVGMVAALLLGTSGLHVYYSQEARMYSLAALFVSLTFLFFVKTLKKGRVGEWVMFSLFLALSVFTDYLPLLIIPGLWLFAWRQKLDRSWWKKLFASHIIMVGTGLLWLPYFLSQLSAGLSVRSLSPAWWQILGQTSFKQLILVPTKFIFGRINMEVNLAQIVVVGVVFLVFGYLLFVSLKTWGKTKLLWYWLMGPTLIAAFVSFWVPTLSYFRFIFVLPAFYLLAATGVKELPKRLSGAVVVLLVFLNLITTSIYLFYPENHREDWKGLISFISRNSIGENSAFVFPANSQQEAYRYYNKDAKIATTNEIKGKEEVIWLVRYVQEISDPEDKTRNKIESLGYRKSEEHNFNGVIVWKYEK